MRSAAGSVTADHSPVTVSTPCPYGVSLAVATAADVAPVAASAGIHARLEVDENATIRVFLAPVVQDVAPSCPAVETSVESVEVGAEMAEFVGSNEEVGTHICASPDLPERLSQPSPGAHHSPAEVGQMLCIGPDHAQASRRRIAAYRFDCPACTHS